MEREQQGLQRQEAWLTVVGGYAEIFLGRYQYARADEALPVHAHADVMEICYLARGMQVYAVHGRRYILRGNDCFVTLPGEVHSSAGHPQEKGMLYWLQVPVSIGGDWQLLLTRFHAAPARCFRGGLELRGLFDAVLEAHHHADLPYRRLLVQARVVELLHALATYAHAPNTDPLPDPMNELLSYIEAHLDHPHTIAALAAHMGLSVSRFKARFKADVGIPPAEYLLRRRVARARDLLANPRMSITDIAYALGFSSSQHFATVIKRFTGASPSRLRNQP